MLSRDFIVDRLKAKGKRRLGVTPLLADSVQEAGVDVRLGPDFIVLRHSATAAFDALNKEQDPRNLQERVEKAWGEPFILHPGELVLASTLEYIVVPHDLTAQVITRSSYGRLGLITATAVQVHPGSPGCITLELVNHGETPIALTPGARLGQLVFFTMTGPTKAEEGKYQYPVGPEFSKVQLDRDAELLNFVGHDAQSRLHPRAAPLRDQPISFSLASPDVDIANTLQMIAEWEGAEAKLEIHTELGEGPVSEIVSRLFGGDTIVTYLVAGFAALSALPYVIARFTRAIKMGVVIEVTEDGATVTPAPELPRGTVAVVGNRERVELHLPPTGGVAELRQLLVRMMQRHRTRAFEE